MKIVVRVIVATLCAVVGGLFVFATLLIVVFTVLNPDSDGISREEWVLFLFSAFMSVLSFVAAGLSLGFLLRSAKK